MSTDEKDKTYNVLSRTIHFLSGYHEITILGFTFIFFRSWFKMCFIVGHYPEWIVRLKGTLKKRKNGEFRYGFVDRKTFKRNGSGDEPVRNYVWQELCSFDVYKLCYKPTSALKNVKLLPGTNIPIHNSFLKSFSYLSPAHLIIKRYW